MHIRDNFLISLKRPTLRALKIIYSLATDKSETGIILKTAYNANKWAYNGKLNIKRNS